MLEIPASDEDWHTLSYAASQAKLASMGLRMATAAEVRKQRMTASSGAPDQWVPVSEPKGWMQLAATNPNVFKLHAEVHGSYPSWGDAASRVTARGLSLMAVKQQCLPPQACLVSELLPEAGQDWHGKSYDELVAQANHKGYRLASGEELAAAMIKGSAAAADQWVPVSNPKDWMQVAHGNQFLFKSHTEAYGALPFWGDTNQRYGFRANSLMVVPKNCAHKM